MKAHSSDFKNQIKEYGRELDSKITYTLNGATIELGQEELNSITPHYEGDILKSVMKQLDIDSSVEIPVGTIISYQLGVKTRNDAIEDYTENYDYINFGNYIVKEVEEQKDLQSYKITCYDKMLYSMKDYEDIGVVYPITIRDYLNALCQYIGLTFKNRNSTFANYSKEIPYELYLDSEGNTLNYTFRDVLDEIAQATASTICINESDDELEIRYITPTSDTINDEYLKDINVDFGKKYGPINSIVLSRSQGADNIYMQDDQSIEQDGLCEVKISDNQIMNRNDRDTYLADIFNTLNRTKYYLNDFSSTGIGYYNLCDRYSITIGNDTYSCVMFNNEINITQGLEERIYTDQPEQGETDYKKADKTDRKINQTYIMVDKQNQVIESVVSNVTAQNNKISQIAQTVDEINAKISDIADVTISSESDYAIVSLEQINASEPVQLKVRPNISNISYLYPRNNLYPSNSLYSTTRIVRFTNTSEYEQTQDAVYNDYRNYFSYDGTTYTLLVLGTDYQAGDTISGTIYQNKEIDYELPDDLLYYNSQYYDEFYLDYDSQTCQITKRCGYNADGTTYPLSAESVVTYSYPTIALTDGDYTISVLGYNSAYIFVRLMANNIYTTQFATRVEVNSAIEQTAQEINIEVAKKVNEDEIISKINLSSEQATINSGKISLQGKTIDLSSDNIVINSANFNVDNEGNMTCNNGTFRGEIIGSTFKFGDIVLERKGAEEFGMLTCNSYTADGSTYLGRTFIDGNNIVMNGPSNSPLLRIQQDEGFIGMYMYGDIRATGFYNISKADEKKNIKKYEGALKLINDAEIYSYNWNNENDKDKKHYGLVIGDKYSTPKEFINKSKDGIDIYSTLSICLQAIKEQQQEIEQLKKEIKLLKEECLCKK